MSRIRALRSKYRCYFINVTCPVLWCFALRRKLPSASHRTETSCITVASSLLRCPNVASLIDAPLAQADFRCDATRSGALRICTLKSPDEPAAPEALASCSFGDDFSYSAPVVAAGARLPVGMPEAASRGASTELLPASCGDALSIGFVTLTGLCCRLPEGRPDAASRGAAPATVDWVTVLSGEDIDSMMIQSLWSASVASPLMSPILM